MLSCEKILQRCYHSRFIKVLYHYVDFPHNKPTFIVSFFKKYKTINSVCGLFIFIFYDETRLSNLRTSFIMRKIMLYIN